MNTRSIAATELTPQLTARWERIRAQHAEFESPFFTAEFAQAVARHRHDVEIGLLEQDDEVVGFFPFQRTPGNRAVPVGNRLNDFHGVVVGALQAPHRDELLQRLQLRSWNFHHQIAAQNLFAPAFFARSPSPRVELREGFQAFYEERTRAHRRTFKDQRRRLRQLETQLQVTGRGPLRFEFDARDPALLNQLMDWKAAQYRRTRQADLFSFAWTRALLVDLLTSHAPQLRGVLSVLYAGDHPLAMHFGLRSHHCFHCWFPAYDVDLGRWSPGLQLWIKLIEAAAENQISCIDFGSGGELFKQKLANASTWVAQGVASPNRWHGLCQRTWHHATQRLAQSRLKTPLQRMTGTLSTAWKRRAFR